MRIIDADALKDFIQQHDYPLADRLNSIDNGMFTLGIFQAIDEQPTLSPDDLRPVGYNKLNKYPTLFQCSVCGWDDDDTITGSGEPYTYNYCPNCGAKMEVTAE